MVLCAVEEVGHVEDEEAEVVCCVDAGVDVAEEPFVPEHQPLFYARPRGKPVSFAVVVVPGA